MTLVRTSYHEELIRAIQSLDSDRPQHLSNLLKLSKWLFKLSGMDDNIEELEFMIYYRLESQLNMPFVLIERTYDSMKLQNNFNSYIVIGESIDKKEITFYDLKLVFDDIETYIMELVSDISQDVRFTRQMDLLR